ncbi:MAG TPA: ChrR family anti-sigma-E factor [Rhodospirillales bacterium]|jgi:putative transcriptional regulator|nr:ChrR family anti-sigma-E factor [Rhodospirillales bacterium]
MITHHPKKEILLDYAAGALGEGPALAVASHAALCRECAEQIEMLEALGGALLEEVTPAPVSDMLLEQTLAMLDEPEPAMVAAAQIDAETAAQVPEPLLRYIGRGLAHLAWRRVGGIVAAVEEVRLPVAAKNVKVSLMRLKAGSLMPRHSHRGNEFTLVLAGGFSDGGNQYGPGDFVAKDPSHTHQPVVDDDGECLCLVVLDAPLRLTGAMGKLINPFLRI